MELEPPAIADAVPSPEPSDEDPFEFEYAADGLELFGILLLNALLTLLTLGIYYAWGRARELRFVISSARAEGDPLEFRGTGGELFRGLLKAWLIFFVPLLILSYLSAASGSSATTSTLLLLTFYGLVLLALPFAIVGSLRYRLSRTSWRGIRFGLDGTAGQFGVGWLPRALLTGITLGLAYPMLARWRRHYVLTHATFGTEHFAFDGETSELYPRYLLAWFLTIPTLGLSLGWYHGEQQQYFWNHTALGAARFHSSLSGMEWLKTNVLVGLLVLITFGLAGPWAYVKLHQKFFDHLTLDRALDLAAIRQSSATGSGTGEQMGDVLDLPSGLDIG